MSKFYSTNSFCIFSTLLPKHYANVAILAGAKMLSKVSTSYKLIPIMSGCHHSFFFASAVPWGIMHHTWENQDGNCTDAPKSS